MQLTNQDTQLSFVVEFVARPGAHRMSKSEKFCESASSSELRALIVNCSGLVKLRGLNAEETNQIEAFKKEAEETGDNLNVRYENEHLVSKTVGIENFDLTLSSEYRLLSINAETKPYIYSEVILSDFFDKKFTVVGPVEDSNCRHSPVDGLRVIHCMGVQILEPSEAGLDDDNKPEEGKPAKPSLDDLSPEELRKLLKDILERL